MGIRQTQLIGLNRDADDFLDNNAKCVEVKICKECGHKTGGGFCMSVYDEETGVQKGMFEDGPLLHEYELKDGSKVREIVQADPWSSGPCIFLCLQDEDGKMIGEWDDDEMNRYLYQ